MVPWGWEASKSAASAAEDLRKVLKKSGASSVRVETQAGVVRVLATFDVNPFAHDDAEFVLTSSTSTAAFRAAASMGAVWPFSDNEHVQARNKKRLLKVRATLFSKYGWSCACPPDANPFAAAKCALTCDY